MCLGSNWTTLSRDPKIRCSQRCSNLLILCSFGVGAEKANGKACRFSSEKTSTSSTWSLLVTSHRNILTPQGALAALPHLFCQLGQYGLFDVYTPSGEKPEKPTIGGLQGNHAGHGYMGREQKSTKLKKRANSNKQHKFAGYLSPLTPPSGKS